MLRRRTMRPASTRVPLGTRVETGGRIVRAPDSKSRRTATRIGNEHAARRVIKTVRTGNVGHLISYECCLADRAQAAARRRRIHSLIYARRQLQALVRRRLWDITQDASTQRLPV